MPDNNLDLAVPTASPTHDLEQKLTEQTFDLLRNTQNAHFDVGEWTTDDGPIARVCDAVDKADRALLKRLIDLEADERRLNRLSEMDDERIKAVLTFWRDPNAKQPRTLRATIDYAEGMP